MPLPATWISRGKEGFQAQQQTLYSRRNEADTRNVAVNIRFLPASSSAAIGEAIFSKKASQNLDYTFKRAAKP